MHVANLKQFDGVWYTYTRHPDYYIDLDKKPLTEIIKYFQKIIDSDWREADLHIKHERGYYEEGCDTDLYIEGYRKASKEEIKYWKKKLEKDKVAAEKRKEKEKHDKKLEREAAKARKIKKAEEALKLAEKEFPERFK